MRHPRVLSATADHLTLYRDNGFLTPDLEPRFSARRLHCIADRGADVTIQAIVSPGMCG
ncbi:hypothetical protein BCAR13_890010 [Paraburkholderia caribensis]|nr:hypothetical protein BCAR13_890010 [Paraburkholderia caribensis]